MAKKSNDKPRCWLVKAEPDCYSIDDLKRDRKTFWDGVRNYQARNFMRDDMRVGDGVLFYHSGAEPPGVVGVARVCKAGYPDHTALDPKQQHYDPKASKDNPIWMMVDVEFVEKFPRVVSLKEMKERADLEGMSVLQRGQRLSVMPIEPRQFEIVCAMGRGGK